jgi:replicative DNA helicase
MRSTELSILYSALTNQERLFLLLKREPDIFLEPDLNFCRVMLGDLFQNTTTIDTTVFSTELNNRRKPGIEPARIMGDLVLSNSCLNYEAVLDQLDEQRRKRMVKHNAERIIDAIKSNSIDYDTAIDRLILDYETGKQDSFVEFIDYVNENDLDEIFKSLDVIRTGYRPIDEKIYGIYGGQLILVAARPGCGKTSLALELVMKMNEPVLFFSMEMNRQEIYAKILSSAASVESWKILFNKMTTDERERVLSMHVNYKTRLKLTLFDEPLDLRRIVYYINHYVSFKKPKVLIIDYIQLLAGAKGENENVRVGMISRTLKLLAMKHHVPIIALSQLSRANLKDKRKPELQDLRGSGSLEQDANIVIFLYEDDEGQTIGAVAKSRMSKTGTLDGLKFEKQFGRFIDVRENDSTIDWINN